MFETQQCLELEWRDSRISLHDLQEHNYQNTLLEAEKNLIWIPSVTFLNTAQQERSARDNSSMVTVSRLGPRTRSSISERKNIYIYKGSENPLLISRVYSVKWLCSYDMQWYPFDTQVSKAMSTYLTSDMVVEVCELAVAPSGNSEKYLQLELGDHSYTGDRELTQYFIRYRVLLLAGHLPEVE